VDGGQFFFFQPAYRPLNNDTVTYKNQTNAIQVLMGWWFGAYKNAY